MVQPGQGPPHFLKKPSFALSNPGSWRDFFVQQVKQALRESPEAAIITVSQKRLHQSLANATIARPWTMPKVPMPRP